MKSPNHHRQHFGSPSAECIRQLLAESRQTRRELEDLRLCMQQWMQGPAPSPESVPDYFALIRPYVKRYTHSDRRMLLAALRYLRAFCKKAPLPLDRLTKACCREYLDYLRARLSGNTSTEYFKKFRKTLFYLIDEGHLAADPSAGIRLTQCTELTKAFLTDEELIRLAATPSDSPVVKCAFLFACYTGLRRCDVAALTYRQVDYDARRLMLIQQKVRTHSSRSVLHLTLHTTALQLLGPAGPDPDAPVFPLPPATTLRKALLRWVARAGIRKHITFHCARHTFITRLMTHGANIATTASLAGHSSTRHTEKYIHVVDELKQKAIDSLPPIPLEE